MTPSRIRCPRPCMESSTAMATFRYFVAFGKTFIASYWTRSSGPHKILAARVKMKTRHLTNEIIDLIKFSNIVQF